MQMSRSIETDDGEMIVKRVSVPVGLEELMEGLTKEVILKKPKDIYVFASEYFSHLLEMREKGGFRGITGRKAQSVTRQMSRSSLEKMATKIPRRTTPSMEEKPKAYLEKRRTMKKNEREEKKTPRERSVSSKEERKEKTNKNSAKKPSGKNLDKNANAKKETEVFKEMDRRVGCKMTKDGARDRYETGESERKGEETMEGKDEVDKDLKISAKEKKAKIEEEKQKENLTKEESAAIENEDAEESLKQRSAKLQETEEISLSKVISSEERIKNEIKKSSSEESKVKVDDREMKSTKDGQLSSKTNTLKAEEDSEEISIKPQDTRQANFEDKLKSTADPAIKVEEQKISSENEQELNKEERFIKPQKVKEESTEEIESEMKKRTKEEESVRSEHTKHQEKLLKAELGEVIAISSNESSKVKEDNEKKANKTEDKLKQNGGSVGGVILPAAVSIQKDERNAKNEEIKDVKNVKSPPRKAEEEEKQKERHISPENPISEETKKLDLPKVEISSSEDKPSENEIEEAVKSHEDKAEEKAQRSENMSKSSSKKTEDNEPKMDHKNETQKQISEEIEELEGRKLESSKELQKTDQRKKISLKEDPLLKKETEKEQAESTTRSENTKISSAKKEEADNQQIEKTPEDGKDKEDPLLKKEPEKEQAESTTQSEDTKISSAKKEEAAKQEIEQTPEDGKDKDQERKTEEVDHEKKKSGNEEKKNSTRSSNLDNEKASKFKGEEDAKVPASTKTDTKQNEEKFQRKGEVDAINEVKIKARGVIEDKNSTQEKKTEPLENIEENQETKNEQVLTKDEITRSEGNKNATNNSEQKKNGLEVEKSENQEHLADMKTSKKNGKAEFANKNKKDSRKEDLENIAAKEKQVPVKDQLVENEDSKKDKNSSSNQKKNSSAVKKSENQEQDMKTIKEKQKAESENKNKEVSQKVDEGTKSPSKEIIEEELDVEKNVVIEDEKTKIVGKEKQVPAKDKLVENEEKNRSFNQKKNSSAAEKSENQEQDINTIKEKQKAESENKNKEVSQKVDEGTKSPSKEIIAEKLNVEKNVVVEHEKTKIEKEKEMSQTTEETEAKKIQEIKESTRLEDRKDKSSPAGEQKKTMEGSNQKNQEIAEAKSKGKEDKKAKNMSLNTTKEPTEEFVRPGGEKSENQEQDIKTTKKKQDSQQVDEGTSFSSKEAGTEKLDEKKDAAVEDENTQAIERKEKSQTNEKTETEKTQEIKESTRSEDREDERSSPVREQKKTIEDSTPNNQEIAEAKPKENEYNKDTKKEQTEKFIRPDDEKSKDQDYIIEGVKKEQVASAEIQRKNEKSLQGTTFSSDAEKPETDQKNIILTGDKQEERTKEHVQDPNTSSEEEKSSTENEKSQKDTKGGNVSLAKQEVIAKEDATKTHKETKPGKKILEVKDEKSKNQIKKDSTKKVVELSEGTKDNTKEKKELTIIEQTETKTGEETTANNKKIEVISSEDNIKRKEVKHTQEIASSLTEAKKLDELSNLPKKEETSGSKLKKISANEDEGDPKKLDAKNLTAFFLGNVTETLNRTYMDDERFMKHLKSTEATAEETKSQVEKSQELKKTESTKSVDVNQDKKQSTEEMEDRFDVKNATATFLQEVTDTLNKAHLDDQKMKKSEAKGEEDESKSRKTNLDGKKLTTFFLDEVRETLNKGYSDDEELKVQKGRTKRSLESAKSIQEEEISPKSAYKTTDDETDGEKPLQVIGEKAPTKSKKKIKEPKNGKALRKTPSKESIRIENTKKRSLSQDQLKTREDRKMKRIQSMDLGKSKDLKMKKQASFEVEKRKQAEEKKKAEKAKLEDVASKTAAALKIQALWRGLIVRKRSSKRIEDPELKIAEAVLKIQAIWRGFQVRKYKKRSEIFGKAIEKEEPKKEDLQKLKKNRRTAAQKIQAAWRGYNVRKNMKEVNKKFEEIEENTNGRRPSEADIYKAATRIQAGVRGYMVRRKNHSHLNSIAEEAPKLSDEEILQAIEELDEIPLHSPEVPMRIKRSISVGESPSFANRLTRTISVDSFKPLEKLKHNSVESEKVEEDPIVGKPDTIEESAFDGDTKTEEESNEGNNEERRPSKGSSTSADSVNTVIFNGLEDEEETQESGNNEKHKEEEKNIVGSSKDVTEETVEETIGESGQQKIAELQTKVQNEETSDQTSSAKGTKEEENGETKNTASRLAQNEEANASAAPKRREETNIEENQLNRKSEEENVNSDLGSKETKKEKLPARFTSEELKTAEDKILVDLVEVKTGGSMDSDLSTGLIVKSEEQKKRLDGEYSADSKSKNEEISMKDSADPSGAISSRSFVEMKKETPEENFKGLEEEKTGVSDIKIVLKKTGSNANLAERIKEEGGALKHDEEDRGTSKEAGEREADDRSKIVPALPAKVDNKQFLSAASGKVENNSAEENQQLSTKNKAENEGNNKPIEDQKETENGRKIAVEVGKIIVAERTQEAVAKASNPETSLKNSDESSILKKSTNNLSNNSSIELSNKSERNETEKNSKVLNKEDSAEDIRKTAVREEEMAITSTKTENKEFLSSKSSEKIEEETTKNHGTETATKNLEEFSVSRKSTDDASEKVDFEANSSNEKRASTIDDPEKKIIYGSSNSETVKNEKEIEDYNEQGRPTSTKTSNTKSPGKIEEEATKNHSTETVTKNLEESSVSKKSTNDLSGKVDFEANSSNEKRTSTIDDRKEDDKRKIIYSSSNSDVVKNEKGIEDFKEQYRSTSTKPSDREFRNAGSSERLQEEATKTSTAASKNLEESSVSEKSGGVAEKENQEISDKHKKDDEMKTLDVAVKAEGNVVNKEGTEDDRNTPFKAEDTKAHKIGVLGAKSSENLQQETEETGKVEENSSKDNQKFSGSAKEDRTGTEETEDPRKATIKEEASVTSAMSMSSETNEAASKNLEETSKSDVKENFSSNHKENVEKTLGTSLKSEENGFDKDSKELRKEKGTGSQKTSIKGEEIAKAPGELKGSTESASKNLIEESAIDEKKTKSEGDSTAAETKSSNIETVSEIMKATKITENSQKSEPEVLVKRVEEIKEESDLSSPDADELKFVARMEQQQEEKKTEVKKFDVAQLRKELEESEKLSHGGHALLPSKESEIDAAFAEITKEESGRKSEGRVEPETGEARGILLSPSENNRMDASKLQEEIEERSKPIEKEENSPPGPPRASGALNEDPPAGAEVLTSFASQPLGDAAQASDKDASPSGQIRVSMEAEKRNNATVHKKSMEVEAATKIQAGFRGYQVRKQLKSKVPGDGQKRSTRRKNSTRMLEAAKGKPPSDLEQKSAVKIQAGVRGFLVRRRQQKSRKQKDNNKS